MEFHNHAHSMDFVNSSKLIGSDDDFGGATTAAETGCDFTEFSGSEDANVGQRVMSMMPSMAGMVAMPCAMPMFMQAATPLTQGVLTMPVCSLPTASQGPQTYCLTMAPDGTRMLIPVSTGQMSTWGHQQIQPMPMQNQFQQGPPFSDYTPPVRGENMVNLEARAATLSAYAAEVKAEARKAKAAAAAAARRGRIYSSATTAGTQSGRRTTSDSTPRWADIDLADQSLIGFDLSSANDDEIIPNDDRTTLMFRNLPNDYNRSTLLHMLDSEGFAGTYNLVYLPTDFRNFAGFGYAFVNFVTHDEAKRAKVSFQGFVRWRVPSRKTCDVVWSGPVQGLQAHTERYRNSPVMHDSVPDEYKPAVFADGIRVTFPAPTKRIRPPRVRRNSSGDGGGFSASVGEHVGQSKYASRGKIQ